MSLHVGAAPGDIAETVLLPGDPRRAEWAAERFLTNPRRVNDLRGMSGLTGSWQDTPVTIHGSGMGMPSLAIYATELIRDHGARTLIRVGSCGGMQAGLGLNDVILAMTASSTNSPSSSLFREMQFAPCADWPLLRAAVRAAESRGITPHVGGIHSTDSFYDERPDLTEQLRRHRTLAVEMETAELYTIAARHGVRALSILTVSDNLVTGAAMPPADREQGLSAMFDIALAAAFAG
ncbi:purine-nucleoside phosphorylase [Roseovarius sp. TE539]|uniref:purine-nucleoside phosphorylase n=1 Tax=Roseovarius sp. TE539 TaxID=2249812 RepID=UPI000DE10124|nr:purine-nucleoside phosphorylase [Roseovarius sp. TE539]RBI72345.1 purine-nucleoside phosphorylase [Roseovarius sp. TE539]